MSAIKQLQDELRRANLELDKMRRDRDKWQHHASKLICEKNAMRQSGGFQFDARNDHYGDIDRIVVTVSGERVVHIERIDFETFGMILHSKEFRFLKRGRNVKLEEYND